MSTPTDNTEVLTRPAEPLRVTVTPRKADPSQEYVAGGGLNWLSSFLQALPHYVDDVTRDFGDDLYERMMHDAQVSSCINTLKNQILANKVALPCAVDDKDERFDQAKEISEFCDRVLASLDTPLFDVLWNLLDALAYGHKVAEKVYKHGTGQDRGKLVLRAIKVKPRRTTAFVTDAYSNVVGLLALIPGVSWSSLGSAWALGVQGSGQGQDAPEPAPPSPNLLSRDRFVVLTCRTTNGDPRGMGLLRPAYNPWFLKTQVWPEYLKYLTQFASPSLVGEVSPNATALVPLLNADGTNATNNDGDPIYLTPEQAMLASLLGFRSGTAIVIPSGAKVTPLQMAGSGEAFTTALEMFNREIDKAITGQTLATGEAQHDTRAASQVHQDVLGGVAAYGRSLCETTLYRDVLLPLVVLNYGAASANLTPWPHLSDVEQQDWTAQAEALAALVTSGYLDRSQFPDMDAKLGLPKRAETEAEAPGGSGDPADPGAALPGAQGQEPGIPQGDDGDGQGDTEQEAPKQ